MCEKRGGGGGGEVGVGGGFIKRLYINVPLNTRIHASYINVTKFRTMMPNSHECTFLARAFL